MEDFQKKLTISLTISQICLKTVKMAKHKTKNLKKVAVTFIEN